MNGMPCSPTRAALPSFPPLTCTHTAREPANIHVHARHTKGLSAAAPQPCTLRGLPLPCRTWREVHPAQLLNVGAESKGARGAAGGHRGAAENAGGGGGRDLQGVE